jgi:hypothetical protein
MGKLDDLISAVGKAAPESKYIRAYHGSPRTEHFDKFDPRFIGSGEGAQMYAYGHYSSQAEPVATGYRDRLSPRRDLFVGGEPIPAAIDPDGSARVAALRALRQAAHGTEDPVTVLRSAYAIAADQPDRQFASKVLESLNDIKQRGVRVGPPKGTMYELEIRHPEQALLDWDAPLRSQPEIMRRVPEASAMDADATGYSLYDWMKAWHGGPRAASEALLKDHGVPGVRYLDSDSRAAAAGTHNYVMFPGTEDSIRILRKYGLLAPMAAAGMGGE